MKTLRIFGALSLLMAAWTVGLSQTSDVRLIVSPNNTGVQAENTSAKEIVLLTVTVSSKGHPDFPSVHDYYFKPGGMAPGDIEEVATPIDGYTLTGAKPLFIQFGDGTTWGADSELQVESATQETIAERKPLRDFYESAILAYYGKGESAFLDRLNLETTSGPIVAGYLRPTVGFARKYLKIQQQSGTAAAVDQIQKRLDAAKARPF